MWGIVQPDLIRVWVDEVCGQLAEQFPGFFATHLLCAFAARARGRDRRGRDSARPRPRAIAAPAPLRLHHADSQ